ncbi:hypothetical protein C2I06_12560 [Niallia circulans]|uniref:hypothetical protein n=1 Tax=Niallia circulans TaxID=1397 RepID=UPI000F451C00|nr:hypothetical protein [Niallia circulans]AYV67632.1 hypothetical protein C2I06_12560 [Niallia circulans]
MKSPAYMLYEILKEVNQQPLTRQSKYRDTWGSVLDIDKDDTIGLLTSISIIIDNLAKTKVFMENNDYDEEDYKFIEKIERALGYVDTDGNMERFVNNIDSETVSVLKYIARDMNKDERFNYPEANLEEVKSLIIEVDNLMDSIVSSNLPKDIQSLLFRNLTSIREALSSYKVGGIQSIRDALERTLGSLMINHEKISSIANETPMKKTYSLLDKLNAIVSTGVGMKELLAPVMQLLIK